jgi:TPR repeat protein
LKPTTSSVSHESPCRRPPERRRGPEVLRAGRRTRPQPRPERTRAHSQDNLDDLYYRGEGVRRNYATARLWYEKAAEQGFPPSQFSPGLPHYAGLGVPADDARARQLFAQAAAQRFAPAQAMLDAELQPAEGGE